MWLVRITKIQKTTLNTAEEFNNQTLIKNDQYKVEINIKRIDLP